MIREAIKSAMKIRKVTQTDLANHIGVTRSTMSLFLNGKTGLNQEKIEALFAFLEIELVYQSNSVE